MSGKFEGGRGPWFLLVRGSWEAPGAPPGQTISCCRALSIHVTADAAKSFQHPAGYYDFGTGLRGARVSCPLALISDFSLVAMLPPVLILPLVCH